MTANDDNREPTRNAVATQGEYPHVDPDTPNPATSAEIPNQPTSSPPPWQRVTSQDGQQSQAENKVTAASSGIQASGQASPSATPPAAPPNAYANGDAPTVTVKRPEISEQRTSVTLNEPEPVSGQAGGNARRPSRGPRRASLQVKRVDPWSVLKLSLVLGVAMFFVWLIAVGVLYGVLNGMGVWDKINSTASDLLQGNEEAADATQLISAGKVFIGAAVLGAINVVLFTALATVGAFIYNVSADLAGGLEVTLSERD